MKEVTIFTSDTCTYCHAVKKYFDEKKIKYIEKNISRSPENSEELVKNGYRSVPLIIIDDKVILGFDKEKIDEMLNI